jgi:hypothetical protein
MEGHSNRGFILRTDDQEIRFFAKLSQSERGFWGLGPERAAELIGAGEALVLLTGPFEGFYIPADRLARLLPSFSKGSERPEYKIHENKINKEARFTTLVKLWSYLKPTARPRR